MNIRLLTSSICRDVSNIFFRGKYDSIYSCSMCIGGTEVDRGSKLQFKYNLNYCQTRYKTSFYKEKTIRLMYYRARSFDVVKYKETPRCQWNDWNTTSELFAFSKRLKEDIDIRKLSSVFITQSYVDELASKQKSLQLPTSNQTTSNVQFLNKGRDALSSFIKSYLRYTFNKLPEDGILAIKNYLMSEKVLSDIASQIGCKDLIQSSVYPLQSKDLAECFLALVGAIEEEGDDKRTSRFVVDIVMSYLYDKDILDDIWTIENPREIVAKILENSGLPKYEARILYQVGMKSLESCFVVGLYVGDSLVGSSPGETVDIAEECASLNTLKRFFDLEDSREPMKFGKYIDGVDFNHFKSEYPKMHEWRLEIQ